MKRSFLFFLLCLTGMTLAVQAQKRQYQMKGFMGVQGGESFTYRLELKDSTGNLLSGYAFTYLNEQNDVKAYVVAEVDRQAKTLKLRETEIVHNHYFVSKAIICLVDALLTYNNKEHSLSGPLITLTAGNGASCSKGSITFFNAAELDQVFNPAAVPAPATAAATSTPAIPAAKPKVKVVYDTLPKRRPVATTPLPAPVKKAENITEGKDKTYAWVSDNIVMELWDGNNIDNDKVTVLLNGNEVLKGYVLTKEPKRLTFPIGGNELNIITIIADNEGADPPNTANILLKDNDTQYEVIAHNAIGKRALIKIRKKLP